MAKTVDSKLIGIPGNSRPIRPPSLGSKEIGVGGTVCLLKGMFYILTTLRCVTRPRPNWGC